MRAGPRLVVPAPAGRDREAEPARPASGKSAETRARILHAAVTLFARHGVGQTTLREITRLAGVNMAAVNYHFGSKEALANAVFAAVSERANTRRRRAIADCVARAAQDGVAPELGALIDIFLQPYLDREEPETAMLLVHLVMLHRIDPTPWTKDIIAEKFDALAEEFVAALRLALPHLSEQELWWRYYFMPGTVVYALTEGRGSERLRRLSRGDCDTGDWEEMSRQLRTVLVNAFAGAVPTDPAGRAGAGRGRSPRPGTMERKGSRRRQET